MSKNFYNETLGIEINFLSDQEESIAFPQESTSRPTPPVGYYITKNNDSQMKGICVRSSDPHKNVANLQGRQGEGFHYYFEGEESTDGDILVSDDDYAADAPITFTATNAIGGDGLIQIKNSILIMDEQSATPAANVSYMVMKYKTI